MVDKDLHSSFLAYHGNGSRSVWPGMAFDTTKKREGNMDQIGFVQEVQERGGTREFTDAPMRPLIGHNARAKGERRSEAEVAADITRAQMGDTSARDRLLADYERMIGKLVFGYVRKGIPDRTRVLEAEDLRQCGRVALLESIGSFDQKKGIPFSTHAYLRIRNALLVEIGASYILTSGYPKSRSISKRVQQFGRRVDTVARRLGREPRQNELYAGLSKSEQHTLLHAESVVAMARSRPGAQGGSEVDWESFPDGKQVGPETALSRKEERELAAKLIKTFPWLLTGAERQAVELYLFVNEGGRSLNFSEIGKVMDKSSARAYQAYRNALTKLREYFVSQFGPFAR